MKAEDEDGCENIHCVKQPSATMLENSIEVLNYMLIC